MLKVKQKVINSKNVFLFSFIFLLFLVSIDLSSSVLLDNEELPLVRTVNRFDGCVCSVNASFNQSYLDTIYHPLENQRLSTSNNVEFSSVKTSVLINSGDAVKYDINSNVFYAGDEIGVVNLESGFYNDLSGEPSLATDQRTLSDGVSSALDWNDRKLYDASGSQASLEWDDRKLYNSTGSTVFDWENRYLNIRETNVSSLTVNQDNRNSFPLMVKGNALDTLTVTPVTQGHQNFTASGIIFTTLNPHNLTKDDVIKLNNTGGTIYTGLTTNTVYIVNHVYNATSFTIRATSASTNISTSGGSGQHWIYPGTKFVHNNNVNLAPLNTTPIYFFTTGTFPAPLTNAGGRPYYIMNAGNNSGFFVSLGSSFSGTNFIRLTSAGTGTLSASYSAKNLLEVRNAYNATSFYVSPNGDIRGGIVSMPYYLGTIGQDNNYAGLWLGSGAIDKPLSSSYTLLGDASNSFINAPTNLWFRVGNSNKMSIIGNIVTLMGNANLTSTGTINATFFHGTYRNATGSIGLTKEFAINSTCSLIVTQGIVTNYTSGC